jgi:hypothetical protein
MRQIYLYKPMSVTEFVACPLLKDIQLVRSKTWLRRVATKFVWWMLKQLNAEFVKTAERIDILSIDETRLLDEIRLISYEIESIWNKEIKYIVCGREMAYKLWGEKAIRMPWETNIGVHLQHGQSEGIIGLKLVVVPWLEGIALLPDLERKG